MTYLSIIERCNRHRQDDFVPLVLASLGVVIVIGAIARERLDCLTAYPEVFTVGVGRVTLNGGLTTADQRTEAWARVCAGLARDGVIPALRGELYAVKTHWSSPEYARLDRAAAAFFGVRSWGVHLHGMVRRADGLHLWIAKRAMDRLVEPGKWDNMVAGGQPAGLSLADNVVKECHEEAGVPQFLARQARAVSLVSYTLQTPQGLRRDTLFCYDLALDEDFNPRNTDGEVERFELWPVAKALALALDSTAFKFNIGLTLVDFAVRHGVLSADNTPDYEAIVRGLRQ